MTMRCMFNATKLRKVTLRYSEVYQVWKKWVVKGQAERNIYELAIQYV